MGGVEEEDFTLVVKKRKLPTGSTTTNFKRRREHQPQPITTQNSFEPLSDEDETDSDSDMETTPTPETAEQSTSTAETSSTTRTRIIRPSNKPKKNELPAIVLHGGISNVPNFKHFIEQHTNKNKYQLKFQHNKTLLYLEDEQAWAKISDLLLKRKLDYHTYTKSNERTHSFVLCGLAEDTAMEEIEDDLKGYERLHLKKIYKMNNTRSTKFLIITEKDVTMNTLQNIRVVANTRIYWQRYYNNKIFIQCHRCQQWGHATSNCFATPNCLKCAQPHLTSECTMSEDRPPKCINCSLDHPANSTECPVYKKMLENYERKKQKPEQTTQATRRKAPDISDTTQFQPLRTPRNPLSQAWKTTGNDNQTSKTDFDEMIHELKILDQQINIKEFTKKLKKLNEKLKSCNTESTKFLTLREFLSELDNGP